LFHRLGDDLEHRAGGCASREELLAMENNIRDKVVQAVEFAFASPEPDPNSALENIFA
jgi:TPP-dependent pyruvate/acetoin dehydrogenase alpha subunit